MNAIYKKEIRTYFNSMIGYVFVSIFLLIIGIYYMSYNLSYQAANFEYALKSITYVYFILVPVLTMRSVSEERRQKTDQMLLTAPVSIDKIILGKFFATATVFMVVIVLICFYPLILKQYGEVNLLATYVGIAGYALLGLAYMSFGIFVSSCTENQIVAAVVTFLGLLLMNFITSITAMLPTDNKAALIMLSALVAVVCVIMYYMLRNVVIPVAVMAIAEAAMIIVYKNKPTAYNGIINKLFAWLSPNDRFQCFFDGNLDFKAVIYLISFIVVFLFLSVQTVKKRRWR